MASENRFWTYNFVLAISLSRIGIGLFQSISGPTLPVLAKNVGQDPKTVREVILNFSFDCRMMK